MVDSTGSETSESDIVSQDLSTWGMLFFSKQWLVPCMKQIEANPSQEMDFLTDDLWLSNELYSI